MKLTNRMNLPEPIMNAVKNDPYTKGGAHISVTDLIAPPRQVALKDKHENEIIEDVSDRIWSLLGQSIHAILERANVTGIAERRLSVDIEGWNISGGMDLVCKQNVLYDYKVTTAYKFKNGVAPPEFEAQLNCYAEILRQNNFPVSELQVVGILRDWSKLEASRDAAYPQSQVVVIEVPLWSTEEIRKFMRDRVILHKQARIELPLCTMEERWGKPDTFAVMKQGGKRALRVYESKDEAHAHASQNAAFYVEKRTGDSTRCRHYCSVSRFCSQWQAIASAQNEWPSLQLGKQEEAS